MAKADRDCKNLASQRTNVITERVIGRLRGRVVEQVGDGNVILDVCGVGYELFVPLRTLVAMPVESEVTLDVHTHVREDQISLYGFCDRDDRVAFRALLTVSGIGPKLALAILSNLSAPQLADTVARQDRSALKGISGVGKKTVERIFLDLKDKLKLSGAIRVAEPSAVIAPDSALETVIGALTQMGYKRSEAERAVQRINGAEGKDTQVLLREALGALG